MAGKKQTRKDYIREVEIPEGISAEINPGGILIKKDSNELRRGINQKINIKRQGDKIILKAEKATKREKKIIGTFVSHIKNMIAGVQEKFVYRLQIASVHFPMNVSVDKEKNEIVVKNFLGEKKDRRVKIIDGAEVRVDKDIITVESIDKEKAGQMTANLEKATRVKGKDRRVFQDGIFIIEKHGRKLV